MEIKQKASGDLLVYWRGERFMTQEILSAESGVSVETIQRIERHTGIPGGVGVRMSTLRKLAKALDVGPQELVEGASRPKGHSRSQLEVGRKLADKLERLVEDAERRNERSDVLWGNWWTAAERATKTSDRLGFEELAERFRSVYSRALRNYEELHGGQDTHGEEFDRLLERLSRQSSEVS